MGHQLWAGQPAPQITEAAPHAARRSAESTASVAVPAGFSSLGLQQGLLRAIRDAGYEAPTPIQVQAIPPALEGRDVLGCARTGTGKTAAFVLPMLQRLGEQRSAGRGAKHVRALVLAPTRELAAQIADSVAKYGRGMGLRHAAIFGGVSQTPQVRKLQGGVDILVATPGRLIDLLDQDLARIDRIEMLVLDEFDRMLDQSFLPAIRRVLRHVPVERQTLLFSATLPPEVESLLKQVVRNPVRVTVGAASSVPSQIDQSVWFVAQAAKRPTLEKLLRGPAIGCALVFTRTKHGANRVASQLQGAGIEADAIHGNKSQNAREHTLGRFRRGELRVLVATDIAARGIDVDRISHVINFDLPADPETYVHRIGRVARAGRTGAALSLCSPEEQSTLARIKRLVGQSLRAMNQPAQVSGHEAKPAEQRGANGARSGAARRFGPQKPREHASTERRATMRQPARTAPTPGSPS